VSRAPQSRQVLEVRRDAATAESESIVSGDEVTTVTFDETDADELLERIFAADVVVVV
jgi:hypothetical protein